MFSIKAIKRKLISDIDLILSEWRYAKKQMDNIQSTNLHKEE